ncbi:uncharacterized protein EHS24_003992 [Apiotrichum porosum]|uniref:AB hydrolase-1 domain-containing protein n=1 Tax=Apiotrichum porosum TaxID=105984 RepID=A0A427Y405_9TREE|nr:uncharacterized protein EHS24_003992 [Apiotrichum porosum]RSH85812.1 hypothetical protein EHS24_003992 [Apiotrichum porosum]
MTLKPTIILVPGCWYPTATYDKLVAALSTRGLKSVPVVLPSSSTGSRDASFLDDITAVRTVILAETTAGRDVVVVAHSYGGMPAYSASKGLTVGSPSPLTAAEGGTGKVIGFVLLASGFNLPGMSFLDPFGGVPPPTWKANTETGFAELLADPVDMFFHDLPVEEAKAWTAQLGKQSLLALSKGGEHSYASWTEAPNYYVLTAEDHALPPALQRFGIDFGKQKGVDVTVHELQTSHSPQLSKPDETAAIIAEAADEFVVKKAKRTE